MDDTISSATKTISKAEQQFQDAFERLKINKPLRLPKGTPVSQNNVAKEAGKDPSALKKSRFPELIRNIQAWVEAHSESARIKRERNEVRQRKHLTLVQKAAMRKLQRDENQERLMHLQSRVVALLQENAILIKRLQAAGLERAS